MANKYSKFELKPFASQYVDPGAVKVSEIYRERFEKNKEKKDLIDQALAQFNVMGGDSHHLDAQKAEIKEQLQGVVAGGNYEDANLVIDEALNNVKTNEALLAAEKSYANRQEELKWQRKAAAEGKQILDWGENAAKQHSSWQYNEKTGKHEANIYQNASEIMLDYNTGIKKFLGTIKSDPTGLSKSKMDQHAMRIMGGYIRSNEGLQDYKRLVELEYDKNIPLEKRQEMARQDILKRVKIQTDQYVHTKVPTGGEKAQAAANALQASILGDSMIVSSKGMTAIDIADISDKGVFDGNMLALTSKMIELEKSGDKKAARDIRQSIKSMGRNMVSDGSLTPEQGAAYQKFEVDHWRTTENDKTTMSSDDLEKVGGLVKYMTEDRWLPDFTLQGGGRDRMFDRIGDYYSGVGATTLAGAGAGTIVAPGAGTLFGGAIGLGAGLLAATAATIGDIGATMLGQAADGWGNVKDMFRAENTDLGFMDSERTQLAQNMANLTKVNNALGTQFTEEDVPFLKKKALEYYDYTVNGGEEIHDAVNNYDGDVYEGNTWIPSPDKEGDQLRTRLNNMLKKSMSLDDFRVVGMKEGSKGYDKFFKTSDGSKVKTTDLEMHGVIFPDISNNIPLQMILETASGEKVRVEMKDQTSRGLKTTTGQIAMAMGRLDALIAEETRKDLENVDNPMLADLAISTKNQLQSLINDMGSLGGNPEEIYKTVMYNHIKTIPLAMSKINKLKAGLVNAGYPAEFIASAIERYVFEGTFNSEGTKTAEPLIATKIRLR
tara:strand:- start:21466 stop:23793 length:2328 start_codon:yes stop_codon:yes gene_type:complete